MTKKSRGRGAELFPQFLVITPTPTATPTSKLKRQEQRSRHKWFK